MLRYSLSSVADRPKGTRTVLPPISPRLAPELRYIAALRVVLAETAKEMRATVIPAYEADLRMERAMRAFTGDAASTTWFASLRALMNQLTNTASRTVGDILDLEAKRHTADFMAIAKRTLGIDLSAVVRDEDLGEYLQAVVSRNVSLITNFSDDLLKRIEQTVYDNSIAGNTVATLKARLKEQFGISDRRAQLIARDQVGKFTGDLNRIRQTQAGVTSYQWMTSHDERVRPRHSKLDGKEYKWGEATGAEDGLPPGQPIRCRCVGRGIVQF